VPDHHRARRTLTLIAVELKISRRAAQSVVAELGCREITGRGRLRACSQM